MIEFDFRSFNRRYLPVVIGGVLLLGASIVALLLVLRGGSAPEPPDQSGEVTSAPQPTDTPLPPSPGQPTDTPTPAITATLEPYTWNVSEGETLLFIIQQFGYRDQSIIPEVLRLNGLSSENAIFAGQELLIPRQTPTPGPTPAPTQEGAPTAENGDGEQTPQPDRTCNLENRCVSPDGQFWLHEVQAGETISGLAFAYDTTVDAIQEDNNVGEFISEGQTLNIRIMVTLTPTLTPTGGPDSTATPTPTVAPPDPVSPATGITIPRSDEVALQWTALRPLRDDQAFRVIVRDASTGDEVLRETTRSTVLRLPDSLRPGAGGSRQFLWQVVVVASDDPNAEVVGGEGQFFSFTWGS